jgi:SAM-dependent methyltransferase
MAKKLLKIDLGCGTKKQEGFIGVDSIKFDGVDIVMHMGKDPWPWKDNSVSEAYCSHAIEHLTAPERIHFVNELHRVLKKGGKATIIVPHWASCRAYGDLTHQWPPVSEFWFYYLSADWRKTEAPHNNFYTCDFECVWGYGMHPLLHGRNEEYKANAVQFWKEAIQDIHATLTKK